MRNKNVTGTVPRAEVQPGILFVPLSVRRSQCYIWSLVFSDEGRLGMMLSADPPATGDRDSAETEQTGSGQSHRGRISSLLLIPAESPEHLPPACQPVRSVFQRPRHRMVMVLARGPLHPEAGY